MPRPFHLPADASPLARAIYMRMQSKGLNPTSLSRAAGLGATYVRDIMVGSSQNPKTNELQRLADALECSPQDLDPSIASNAPDHDSDLSDILPLRPSDIYLIRLWRSLERNQRDLLMLRLSELMPKPTQPR